MIRDFFLDWRDNDFTWRGFRWSFGNNIGYRFRRRKGGR